MIMISQSTIDFLSTLKDNNTREWFEANRKAYQAAKDDFLVFAQTLLSGLEKQDPVIAAAALSVKNCVFRINRDVRFSNDKSPYKTNMGAFFTPAGKNGGKAGYYIHLEPGESFLAGGMYMPDAPTLKLVRQEIDYNLAGFKKILAEKSFQKFFPEGLDKDMMLKKAPSGYAVDHPAIEFLRYKSFTVSHYMKPEFLTQKDAVPYILKGFEAMKPLADFLNQALVV
jgi:uncharacterized protein (TIGR02453 family)